MPVISMDVDSRANEILLRGDIENLIKHRFAWNYVKGYLHPIVDLDVIRIPVADKDVVKLLSEIREMLKKYGFIEEKSQSTEKVLLDFYEEEQRFHDFSKKAFEIRNNICEKADFSAFTDVVAQNLVTRSLYPLQLLSAYHLAFSRNACNFSVPGAGKTSIVYGAYSYLKSLTAGHDSKKIDKLLIVGPLSSFGPWELEYAECFGSPPTVKRLVSDLTREEKDIYLHSKRTAELTLISYASLVSQKEAISFFLRNNGVMVVLDEAHKAKNTDGGIVAQTVLDIAKYCQARVVLTGTPAPNGYEDLNNLFKFIWPTKNVIGFELNQLRDLTERNNTDRVNRLIRNIEPYFIRISKKDLNLPIPHIHKIEVQMGPVQRKIYDFIEKKYVEALIEEGGVDTSTRFKSLIAQARMIRLTQAASNPSMLKKPLDDFLQNEEDLQKADRSINDSDILKDIIEYEQLETPYKYLAVKELVEKIINKGEKVIIWANYIYTINELKRFLAQHGINSQELYGLIPVEKDGIEEESDAQAITREKIIKEFHSPDCPYKVIIANPFAVAESISLHKACHNAIYLERTFNAAHFVQSKDRIHRYGLPEGADTNYYYIISQNSIDETIDARLYQKEKRMMEIMEMPIPLFDNVYNDLGEEDIKALIKDYVRRTKKY